MIAKIPYDEGPLPETDLIRGAKHRDSNCWAALYDRLYPSIFKYVLACVGSRLEAEDVSAQVFLEALRNVNRLPENKPLEAWFHAIARNLIAQNARQNRQQKRASSPHDPNDIQQEVGDRVIERVDLEQALSKLTSEQRDVIILRFFMSMSIKEAAARLGKTENATSVLQVRAVGALRRQLSEATVGRLLGTGGVSA